MEKNTAEYFKKRRALVDNELKRLVTKSRESSGVILTAMNHALKGGKRIRPILCIACAETAGGSARGALKAACAIEMLHSYSLVHDDLPCMDNDNYRRGRLACHKRFGIANAVLTGDALLTYAFSVLSSATKDASANTRMVKELSRAGGIFGMLGGQAADIKPVKRGFAAQEYISIRKTGALIAASCKIGAIAAGADEKEISALFKYGEYTGLVFQVVDDILDNEGFSAILGRKRALEYAQGLSEKAKKPIARFGKKGKALCDIADAILHRKS